MSLSARYSLAFNKGNRKTSFLFIVDRELYKHWGFLRTLEKSAAPRAYLCTSLVFLKIPVCLYNSTMHLDAFFISLVIST